MTEKNMNKFSSYFQHKMVIEYSKEVKLLLYCQVQFITKNIS